MSEIDLAWSALRGERRMEPGWHLRRVHVEANCEILAGIHQPDNTPGLLIEVNADSIGAALRMPKSNGFRLDTLLLGHSHLGRVRIALSLAHPAYMSVFSVLCTDTAAHAAAQPDERSALLSWIGHLHVWQEFMAKHGLDGLSEEGIVGLAGELHLLRDYLAPELGWSAALSTWSGPRGEPNDFAFAGGYLEVKASALQVPELIKIANVDQLDISRGRIHLAHVRFRRTPDGETLPELIESIRMRLATESPVSITEFTSRLLAVGYVQAHADNYSLRLKVEEVHLFEIGTDFPHIARHELRRGIVDGIYTIELDACMPWAVPLSDLSLLCRRLRHDRR